MDGDSIREGESITAIDRRKLLQLLGGTAGAVGMGASSVGSVSGTSQSRSMDCFDPDNQESDSCLQSLPPLFHEPVWMTHQMETYETNPATIDPDRRVHHQFLSYLGSHYSEAQNEWRHLFTLTAIAWAANYDQENGEVSPSQAFGNWCTSISVDGGDNSNVDIHNNMTDFVALDQSAFYHDNGENALGTDKYETPELFEQLWEEGWDSIPDRDVENGINTLLENDTDVEDSPDDAVAMFLPAVTGGFSIAFGMAAPWVSLGAEIFLIGAEIILDWRSNEDDEDFVPPEKSAWSQCLDSGRYGGEEIMAQQISFDVVVDEASSDLELPLDCTIETEFGQNSDLVNPGVDMSIDIDQPSTPELPTNMNVADSGYVRRSLASVTDYGVDSGDKQLVVWDQSHQLDITINASNTEPLTNGSAKIDYSVEFTGTENVDPVYYFISAQLQDDQGWDDSCVECGPIESVSDFEGTVFETKSFDQTGEATIYAIIADQSGIIRWESVDIEVVEGDGEKATLPTGGPGDVVVGTSVADGYDVPVGTDQWVEA